MLLYFLLFLGVIIAESEEMLPTWALNPILFGAFIIMMGIVFLARLYIQRAECPVCGHRVADRFWHYQCMPERCSSCGGRFLSNNQREGS
jgi:hypothetical protein